MKKITDSVKDVYTAVVVGLNRDPGMPECNHFLLMQALKKYSRDVFGESRLQAKIDKLPLTKSQHDGLSTFEEYGFKVDSRSPYLYRRVSNMLYWLCVLKPFSITPKNNETAKNLGLLCEFHNECISYFLVIMFLKAFDYTITIDENLDLFHDFLYDLHFRNISRSSLEFFLHGFIEPIKNPS